MLKQIHIYFTLACFFMVAVVHAQKKLLPLSPSVISATKLDNTLKEGSSFVKWQSNKPIHLFVFIAPDCPLCRNYAPLFNKLQMEYGDRLQICGIVPGRSYSDSLINEFINTFTVSYPVLKDSRQQFKKYFAASTTPEVYLLNNNGDVLYRGAIDNWAVSLGKKRINVTEHYLLDAIKNSLSNIPVAVKYIQPVGCIINDY